MTRSPSFCGVILAAGESSRMGRDKALLPYCGVPMAIHQAEKLAFVCGLAVLVGKDRTPFAGFPYPFVTDGAEPVAAAEPAQRDQVPQRVEPVIAG